MIHMVWYGTALQLHPAPPASLSQKISQSTSTIMASCGSRAGPSSAAGTTSSKKESKKNQNLIHCTLFKCNQCKLLFRHEAAAERHQESCADSDWVSCAKCLVQRFRTDELRSAHEAQCGGKGSHNFEDLPLANEEEDQRDRSGADEVVVIDLQSSDEADSVPFPSTMFKCEFCEIYFLNSDVASTHEAICGSRVRTISAADAIAASSVFDSVGSNAEMAIPIVDGGPGAATYADIGSLPVFDVKMSYNGSSKGTSVTVGDKDLCTICGEGFNGKKILALPKCRHFFCYECIVKWLLHKSNCPTCRATIKEE